MNDENIENIEEDEDENVFYIAKENNYIGKIKIADEVKKNIKTILANLRKDYEDFIIELDEEKDEVTAVSLARKVVIKLDSLGTIETEVYNGYDKVDDNNDNILYKTNKEDLIEIVENERIRGK